MRISLLGPVQATGAGGEPIGIGGPRSRVLLALLALNPGRVVTADRLIEAMYGGDGSANALQSQVSRLRKALGDADPTGVLQFLPGGYRLAVDPSTVDAHEFAELSRAGSRALSAQDHARAAELLRRAESLWRGPALADLDAPFARAQAVRLDEQRLSATEDRVEAELHLGGDVRALVAELRELTAAHPLRERFSGQLMRALHADGQQAEALAVFERTRETLADRLGADPSPELAAVHVAILRGDPGTTPEVPLTTHRPPAQLTSFVGRARELERITALLETSRLVTLTGPGGAGKTRLAIEASQASADVCFVELAGLEPGEDVSHAVFGALGMRESVAGGSGDSLLTRIETALADRPVLLVLDNCEHVVDGAARFTGRLLRACPRLRVLATSREALDIPGESVAPVPPLPGPPGGLSLEDAAAYPAVALFTDRAKAARHDFALGPDNIADVAKICHALDGLPLAIELAAARLRSIPVADIAAHLDDRFRLLSRGSRTAEPRHQTLHAVVSWSWDLLDPAERDLAVRVSAFAGGFTVDAAAQVSGLSTVECVALLGDLADKSLLDVDAGRYRMLTTIRHFCATQPSDVDDDPQDAHARLFHALLVEAEPHLRAADQLDWLARLTVEHDNLYAALRWSRDHDHELALSLIAYLVPYWWLRGLRASAIAHAEGLLARIDAAAPPGLVEEYVLTVLTAATYEPDAPHLAAHMRAIHEIAATLQPPFQHAYLMILWAVFAGPPDEVETPVEQLVGYLTGIPGLEPWVLAVAHLGIAFQYWNLVGDDPRTRDAATECLRRFRAVGDRWGIITALSLLGTWPDRDASRHLTEGIALAEELGAGEDQATMYFLRGQRRVGNDDIDGARADFLSAAELARHAGAREQIALADLGLAQLASRTGELARARSLAETALAECPRGWMQTDQTYVQIKGQLGWIAEAEGDLDSAVQAHREAYALALELRQYALAAAAVAGLASAALWSGDDTRASWLLGAAEVLHETTVSTDPNAAPASVRIHQTLTDPACAAAYHDATGLERAAVLEALEGERVAGGGGEGRVEARRGIYSG